MLALEECRKYVEELEAGRCPAALRDRTAEQREQAQALVARLEWLEHGSAGTTPPEKAHRRASSPDARHVPPALPAEVLKCWRAKGRQKG